MPACAKPLRRRQGGGRPFIPPAELGGILAFFYKRRECHGRDETNPAEWDWSASTTEEDHLAIRRIHFCGGDCNRLCPLSCQSAFETSRSPGRLQGEIHGPPHYPTGFSKNFGKQRLSSMEERGDLLMRSMGYRVYPGEASRQAITDSSGIASLRILKTNF
jgi:hypothetical protein